jgi:hypothetical protein
MTFPATPSNGDLHEEGGRAWRYAAAINAWEEIPNLFATAETVAYDPTTPADWTTDPETVEEALDELAGRAGGGGDSSPVPLLAAIWA